MLSIAMIGAATGLIVAAGVVLRARRSDTPRRTPLIRHGGDMVDWTLEWRRALKSLESEGTGPRPAPQRSVRRS